MARRNYRKSSKKIQPAQLELYFNVQGETGEYIDLSQSVSIANRRFYRQGLNWAVSHFTVSKVSPTESGSVQFVIGKLPNTWVMSNAWEKGFRTWQRMNNEATEESPSIKPKFLDYKIYADSGHHQAGFAANLLPINNAGNAATAGEWEPSKMVVPNTAANAPGTRINNFEITAVGANYPGVSPVTSLDAVSLIDGYSASRGLPNILDPNAPDDASDADGATPENWMSATFNEATGQDDAVISDMITENNLAPYPFENDGTNTDTMYPGGPNQLKGLMPHDIGYFNAGTHANKFQLAGGNFPCGLIKVQSDESCVLKVVLVPGTHRGYLAEPMTEM